MGVREDFFCDDFKTVPVPHLNKQFEFEDINCAGYDIPYMVNPKFHSISSLKIPGLPKCEPTYECSRWQEDYRDYRGGDWEETSCGLSPSVFSHCSQCNMCTSIDDAQIKVRK